MIQGTETAKGTCLQSDIQGLLLFALESLHPAEPQVGKIPQIFSGFHSNSNGLVHNFNACNFSSSGGFNFPYF